MRKSIEEEEAEELTATKREFPTEYMQWKREVVASES